MKTKILILLLSAGLAGRGFAQKVQPLKVGDKLPEILIKHVLGYKTETVKTADFKGKILLLDFWATWCGSCIGDLPRLDSLQKKHQKDFAILLVTDQKRDVIISQRNTLPSLKGLSLPSVYLDTILYQLFPTRTIPHDVLVDRNGMILAITGNENITEDNIHKAIEGKALNFQEERIIDFKGFFLDSVKANILLSYSVFAKYLEGYPSRLGKVRTTSGIEVGLKGTNQPPLALYMTALRQNLAVKPNSMIRLLVKDTTRLKPPLNKIDQKNWSKMNTLTIDIKVPESTTPNVYQKLQEDLNDYFRTRSKIETMVTDCYVLKTIDSTKYKSTSKLYYIDADGTVMWTLKQNSMRELVGLMGFNFTIPLVDETNYKGLIDVGFIPAFRDLAKLKNELRKNGLDIALEKRAVSIITIEDRLN